MRVIAIKTLREFWTRHPSAEIPLRAWHRIASAAKWMSPVDVKYAFRHASVLNAKRVVFNIGGNNFRLVAHMNYRYQVLYIRFVGTHAEYDQIDASEI